MTTPATTIEDRLAALGISLPAAAAAVANYVPWVIAGTQLFISGQLPMENGQVAVKGIVGNTVSPAEGQRAARLCAINILAQAKAALGGDLSRIARLVRLGVYVAGTPDFEDHPAIANGASDLMVEILGDAGRHARAAVGVASLPKRAAVEIEATIEFRG